MSKDLDIKINTIKDNIKEFEIESAYDILYADSFLKFQIAERTFSCYCSKCNRHEKDLSFRDLVIFINDHEELFSVNQIFYFFKCKKDM